MLSTSTRSCTLVHTCIFAFSTQSWSFVVFVRIFTESLKGAHSPYLGKNSPHCETQSSYFFVVAMRRWCNACGNSGSRTLRLSALGESRVLRIVSRIRGSVLEVVRKSSVVSEIAWILRAVTRRKGSQILAEPLLVEERLRSRWIKW